MLPQRPGRMPDGSRFDPDAVRIEPAVALTVRRPPRHDRHRAGHCRNCRKADRGPFVVRGPTSLVIAAGWGGVPALAVLQTAPSLLRGARKLCKPARRTRHVAGGDQTARLMRPMAIRGVISPPRFVDAGESMIEGAPAGRRTARHQPVHAAQLDSNATTSTTATGRDNDRPEHLPRRQDHTGVGSGSRRRVPDERARGRLQREPAGVRGAQAVARAAPRRHDVGRDQAARLDLPPCALGQAAWPVCPRRRQAGSSWPPAWRHSGRPSSRRRARWPRRRRWRMASSAYTQ